MVAGKGRVEVKLTGRRLRMDLSLHPARVPVCRVWIRCYMNEKESRRIQDQRCSRQVEDDDLRC